MSELRLRPATPADVPFLVEAVWAAELVPIAADRCLYECMYGLSKDECHRFLTESLAESGTGHALTYRTFQVLVDDTGPVACCASWIEAAGGQPSGIKIAMALSRFMGLSRWRACTGAVRALAASAPRRTPHALQLESFFVAPEHRGRGAAARLIAAAVAEHAGAEPAVTLAEISLLQENTDATRAYARAGFTEAWRTAEVQPEFLARTGSRGFVQMHRRLS